MKISKRNRRIVNNSVARMRLRNLHEGFSVLNKNRIQRKSNRWLLKRVFQIRERSEAASRKASRGLRSAFHEWRHECRTARVHEINAMKFLSKLRWQEKRVCLVRWCNFVRNARTDRRKNIQVNIKQPKGYFTSDRRLT